MADDAASGDGHLALGAPSRVLHIGNAIDVGRDYRGWFLGSFMGPSVPALYSTEVEVKWGIHAAGDCRTEWGRADCTSVTVCIRGRFRLLFAEPTYEHVLCKEGDFALWGPGVLHKWTAEEDTVMVTVRWPSAVSDPSTPGPSAPPFGAPLVVHVDNAAEVGLRHRGWFMGSFMGPSVPTLQSSHVELKWGVQPSGASRTEWGRADCSTITMCLRGRFRLMFADPPCEHVLCAEGDFAMWGPGVLHKWTAEEDTVMLVVRWPSAGQP